MVFVRYRRPQDYRFGRGSQLTRNSFALEDVHTGEAGTTQSFYEPHEMLALLSVFGGGDWVSLNMDYDNPQNGRIIRNCDGIIWGSCVHRASDGDCL